MKNKYNILFALLIFTYACNSNRSNKAITIQPKVLSYEYSIDKRILDTVKLQTDFKKQFADSSPFFLSQINAILGMKYKALSYVRYDSFVGLKRVGLSANNENFYSCFFNDSCICIFIIGDTDMERVIRFRLISVDSLILQNQQKIIKLSNDRSYLHRIRM